MEEQFVWLTLHCHGDGGDGDGDDVDVLVQKINRYYNLTKEGYYDGTLQEIVYW